MKQKILFMIINMNIGGTEKALLNTLDEIDKNKYDVTILMLEKVGGFLNEIPKWVNIKYLDNYDEIKKIYKNPPIYSAKKLISDGKIIKGLSIALSHLIYKITNDRSMYFKYLLKDCEDIKEEYDIAIAYAGPMDIISYYIINKTNAKKKIQWIHFDVTKIGIDKVYLEKLYSKFDKICVVSQEAKEKLDNFIPSLISKTKVFHNIVCKNKILKMAEKGQGFDDGFDGIRILTVGRLSKEKGQDMVMSVVANLKSDGYKIRWYLVGDGNLRGECEQLINKYKIEKECILLGTKSNPYPYMKECDIYVQSSKHEGYCITLAEAKCFNMPIVSTNFTGANEHIKHEQTGLICSFDKNEMYKSIKRLLDDKKLSERIKSNLNNEFSDSTGEINKLYKLIEDIKEDEKDIIHG